MMRSARQWDDIGWLNPGTIYNPGTIGEPCRFSRATKLQTYIYFRVAYQVLFCRNLWSDVPPNRYSPLSS